MSDPESFEFLNFAETFQNNVRMFFNVFCCYFLDFPFFLSIIMTNRISVLYSIFFSIQFKKIVLLENCYCLSSIRELACNDLLFFQKCASGKFLFVNCRYSEKLHNQNCF